MMPLLRECRRLVSDAVCRVRSEMLRRALNVQDADGRVSLLSPAIPVSIDVHRTASVALHGTLSFHTYMGNRQRIYIRLNEGARMIINGDFGIGAGCSIFVDSAATLYIGGRKNESASGITERSRIMARRSIHIGEDFICAWNVFITDCDWHETEGQNIQEDVHIGNHVWVAPNSSVLKGTRLGEGCIVATGAVLHKIVAPDHCMVGGIPARVLARDRKWGRDMKTPDAFNSEFQARTS